MTSLLPLLVAAVVALPAATAAAATGPFLIGRPLGEDAVHRLARAGAGGSLLLSLGLVAAWARGAGGVVSLGAWYGTEEYQLPLLAATDGLAVGASLLVATTGAVVLRMSEAWLHREPGHLRFFATTLLALASLQAIALAARLELLFFGWELLGLCSFLLIAFFSERPAPVRRALRAFWSYRFADLGLLAVLLLLGEAGLEGRLGPSARDVPEGLAATVGLLLLLTAAGKAGLVPFSGWLARSMEGPTPSTALFYGSLSVAAGPWLLLRARPLFEGSAIALGAIVAVGLLTAVASSLAGRCRTDAKGAIVLAGSAQVGLVVAEIGLGWTTLAALHAAGNAGLRAWQLLRAPSAMHLAHERAGRIGGDPAPPRRIPQSLWARAGDLFGTEVALERAAAGILAAAALLDRASRASERLAIGGRDVLTGDVQEDR